MNAKEEVVSFPQRLGIIAAKKPDSPAITFGDETLSWRELDSESNRMAHALASVGVKMGDLVTIALSNGLPFFTISWGIWKLGATPQPVSSRLPVSELKKIIEVAQSKLVITEDDFKGLKNTLTLSKLLELGTDD